MRKYILLCVLIKLLNPSGINAQLITPLEGIYLKDFFIVNYPDEAKDTSIMDVFCGNKTYNGHQGTDFVLRNFKQMDSGVYAIAAADGVVFKVIENLFDRNKTSDTSLGFGNYVGVWHQINGLNYYTYYAHLRTNSVIVDSGQILKAGQRIGLIGSSGNTSDPHLHFEVWNDSIWLDPFVGICKSNNTRKLWTNQLMYDTALRAINQGIINELPILNDLKESPLKVQDFTASSDSVITYWWQGSGIRVNDTIAFVWRTPDDSIWYYYSYMNMKDYWYYYTYSYISLPFLIRYNPPLGMWKVQFLVNNKLVDDCRFKVSQYTGLNNPMISHYRLTNKGIYVSNEIEVSCTNILGKTIPLKILNGNTLNFYVPEYTGFVVYRLRFQNEYLFIKAILNE